MMRDYHTLVMWIRAFTYGAAICTTSVPILYSFYPWRSRRFGQAFMLQAIAFAAAMDITAFFTIWRPKNIWVLFYADMFILLLIAVATSGLTVLIWRMNRPKSKGRHRRDEIERKDLRPP